MVHVSTVEAAHALALAVGVGWACLYCGSGCSLWTIIVSTRGEMFNFHLFSSVVAELWHLLVADTRIKRWVISALCSRFFHIQHCLLNYFRVSLLNISLVTSAPLRGAIAFPLQYLKSLLWPVAAMVHVSIVEEDCLLLFGSWVSSDVHLWQYSSFIPLIGRCQSIEVHASTVFVGDVVTSCLLGTCRQLSLFSFAPLREAAAFPLPCVVKSHALASDLFGWRTSLLWKWRLLIVNHREFHLWRTINFEVRAMSISYFIRHSLPLTFALLSDRKFVDNVLHENYLKNLAVKFFSSAGISIPPFCQ